MNYGMQVVVGKTKPVSDPHELELVDPATSVGKIAICSPTMLALKVVAGQPDEGMYRELYYQSLVTVCEAMRDLVFKETGSTQKAIELIPHPWAKRSGVIGSG